MTMTTEIDHRKSWDENLERMFQIIVTGLGGDEEKAIDMVRDLQMDCMGIATMMVNGKLREIKIDKPFIDRYLGVCIAIGANALTGKILNSECPHGMATRLDCPVCVPSLDSVGVATPDGKVEIMPGREYRQNTGKND